MIVLFAKVFAVTAIGLMGCSWLFSIWKSHVEAQAERDQQRARELEAMLYLEPANLTVKHKQPWRNRKDVA